MDLGNTIKDIRKSRSLSQGAFAIECGITQTYLSQIESNQKEPTLSVLKKIAERLGIPLPLLFFQSMTEEDIQPSKREIFGIIGPAVKNLIDDMFQI